MSNVNHAIHAQFTKGHLALILSCALLLATFLAVSGTNPFGKKSEGLTNNQQSSFYDQLYSAGTQSSASGQSGKVAGAETQAQAVVPRGPIMPRGNP